MRLLFDSTYYDCCTFDLFSGTLLFCDPASDTHSMVFYDAVCFVIELAVEEYMVNLLFTDLEASAVGRALVV